MADGYRLKNQDRHKAGVEEDAKKLQLSETSVNKRNSMAVSGARLHGGDGQSRSSTLCRVRR